MKAFSVLFGLLTLKLPFRECVETMDKTFFGTTLYKSAENVVYCEEGSSANLACVPPSVQLDSGLTQNPVFTWVNPHTGIPIVNLRASNLPGGELHLSNVIIDDSAIYQCTMATQEQLQKIAYKHTLIVYAIPAYRRSVEHVYVAKTCDAVLIAVLMKEINAIVCTDQAEKCAYQVIQLPCEVFKIEVYVKVQIIVHGATLFAPPKCGPTCARDAYTHNLDRPEVQDKLQLLQKSSEDIFPELTGFKYESSRSTELFIPTCPEGYVIFKDVVCIPCMHGYHADKKDNKTCKECGIYAYQPKFGSSSCIRCPQYGHSDYTASPSAKLCKPLWKTWQGILLICLGVIVLLVVSFLILLHLGAFPCIYQTETQKKSQVTKQEEAEVQNLMTYYEKQAEKEENGEETDEKEDQTMMDRTKVAGKRWYPGLGWR